MLIKKPNPVLKLRSKPVDLAKRDLSMLKANMVATMLTHGGLGLAAIQIAVPLRAFVMMNVEEKCVDFFINPTIIRLTGKQVIHMEGCLSVPNFIVNKKRYDTVQISWRDIDGRKHTKTFTDELSFCIQHEMDHLDGKLIC